VQAIGHRISYDAARAAQVDSPLLNLFEAASVLQDEAWYVERLGMTRVELRERESGALEAVFPHLEEYLTRRDVAPYIVAPIVSDEKWKQFLSTFQGFDETNSGWSPAIVGSLLDGSDSPLTPSQTVLYRSARSMLWNAYT
jgi:acyl-CoA oxidase